MLRSFTKLANKQQLTQIIPSHISALRLYARQSSSTNSKITTKIEGVGENKRILFVDPANNNTLISPWHDITLQANGFYSYVNEIPKGTKAKYEIATNEEFNPIKQDIKDGKLRYFTYGKVPFNYGAMPQTWEDPSHIHEPTGLKGDNDPLDVVELSPGPLREGEIITVKVLGALALIDEGELDWKVIAINAASPLANLLNTAEDLTNVLPGIDSTIREWFRSYKTTDGKPKNEFGFNEKILTKEEAEAAINDAHERWKLLTSGEIDAEKLWRGK